MTELLPMNLAKKKILVLLLAGIREMAFRQLILHAPSQMMRMLNQQHSTKRVQRQTEIDYHQLLIQATVHKHLKICPTYFKLWDKLRIKEIITKQDLLSLIHFHKTL